MIIPNKFSHMGDSPKWVKSKRRREEKRRERLNNGDTNGQAMHGARKPPGPILLGLPQASVQSLGLACAVNIR